MKIRAILAVALVVCGFCSIPDLSASNVTVTAANPNTAAPGTVNLNVAISGSGYKKGARANFFLTGTTNPAGVTVISTAFSASSQVTATINVDANATIASYDVVVTNTDGSNGKGTELFAINNNSNGGRNTGDVSVTSTVSDSYVDSTGATVNYAVQSDGAGAYGNGQLGVVSILQGSASYAWELDMYDSTLSVSAGRNAFITLGPTNQQSAAATMPSIWSSWGTHLEPVRFITHGISCDLVTIKPGSPLACPLLIRFGPVFTSGKTKMFYRLDMEPGNVYQESETQEPLISCNAQDSSGNCIDWSIDSTPPTSQSGGVPTNRVVARLVTTSGAAGTMQGDFYLTFHIRVTNP